MNILITGTSKGIGRYLSEYYLELGHNVIGYSRSNPDIKHAKYQHYSGDIRNEKQIKEMICELRDKTIIDILINNAGIASMNHFLLTPTETARQIIEVNYLGTFSMCREMARPLRHSKNGRIINFTSVAVPLNLEGESAYIASKAAIESLTRTLAKELSPITVNATGPVPTKTDLIAGVPESKINNIISKQAIPCYGDMKDISNVIDFLIKPESDFITGQIIYLGGIY